MPASRSSNRRSSSPTGTHHIPRPMNAFFQFRSHYNQTQGARDVAEGRINQNQISKHAATVWASMTPEEKAPFREMYEQEMIARASRSPFLPHPTAYRRKTTTRTKKVLTSMSKPRLSRSHKRASSLDSISDVASESSSASSSSVDNEPGVDEAPTGCNRATDQSSVLALDPSTRNEADEAKLLPASTRTDSPAGLDIDGFFGRNQMPYLPSSEAYTGATTCGNFGMYNPDLFPYQLASGSADWYSESLFPSGTSLVTEEDLAVLTLTTSSANLTCSKEDPFSIPHCSEAPSIEQMMEWLDFDSWPH